VTEKKKAAEKLKIEVLATPRSRERDSGTGHHAEDHWWQQRGEAVTRGSQGTCTSAFGCRAYCPNCEGAAFTSMAT